MGKAQSTVPRAAEATDADRRRKNDGNVFLKRGEFVYCQLTKIVCEKLERKNYEGLHEIERDMSDYVRFLKYTMQTEEWESDVIRRATVLIRSYEIVIFVIVSLDNVLKQAANNEVINRNSLPGTATEDDVPNFLSLNNPEHNEVYTENDTYASIYDTLSSREYVREFDNTLTDSLKHLKSEYRDVNKHERGIDFDLISVNKPLSGRGDGGRVNSQDPVSNYLSQYADLIKEMPCYYAQLNEILEKDNISSYDIIKVLNIRKNAKEITNSFESKMDEIFKRYEENIKKK